MELCIWLGIEDSNLGYLIQSQDVRGQPAGLLGVGVVVAGLALAWRLAVARWGRRCRSMAEGVVGEMSGVEAGGADDAAAPAIDYPAGGLVAVVAAHQV